MYTFSASLFKALIHLVSSSFFFFIRVISSSTNFRFLEITSSSFCFLTFSNAVMYLLFANLQLLRTPLERSFSWTLISLELMWSYTICWDTEDFSCKLSTNSCLLTLNPLSIVLWPSEKTKMLPQTLQKLLYFWFLWRNSPRSRWRASVYISNVANFSVL